MTAPPAAAGERHKLLLSLVANAATRIPGAAGILLFLPLARAGLGVADYAAVLAAMALGGAATFVFGGVGIAARRMIGEAHGAGDTTGQADAFRSLLLVSAVLGGSTALVVAGWQWWTGAPAVLMLVALIPVASAAINVFDNVRAAYNEHYVTAGLQFAVQVALYALGIGMGAFARDPLLTGMVMGGGSLIASVLTGVALLRAHPVLRHGRARRVPTVLAQAGGAGLADGALMSGLALAVVLVEARAAPETGAWFATVVRLFQTFLSPVLLLLLPLGSYLRLGWATRTMESRRRIVAAAFAGVLLLDLRHLAIGSAAVVAASFAVALLPIGIEGTLIGYAWVTALGLVLVTGDSVRRYRGD